MRTWLLTLLLAAGLAAQPALTPPITTVVLIRHAEVAQEGGAWKLTEPGRVRAKKWALPLGVYEPKALYAGSGPVSLDTLAPTAKALGLTPIPKDPKDPEGLAKEILADHAGTSVVVCWPAKALKPLALALGVPEPLAEWPEVWHQIWVIRLDAKGGAIDTGSQGAPPDPLVISGYAVVWGDRK